MGQKKKHCKHRWQPIKVGIYGYPQFRQCNKCKMIMKRLKIMTDKKVRSKMHGEKITLFVWDKWRKATLDE